MTVDIIKQLNDSDMVLVGLGEELNLKSNASPDEQENIKKFYDKLNHILLHKNYFIISLCTDDEIYKSSIDESRVVTPCGGYRLYQCPDGCEHRLYENTEKTCAICGKELIPNNINADNYLEEGYLSQWEKYKKWVQGTLNRRLFTLELGVGMKYPSVIRWPFERTTYINNQGYLLRVHSSLYQIPAEMKDKASGIQNNAISFVLDLAI